MRRWSAAERRIIDSGLHFGMEHSPKWHGDDCWCPVCRLRMLLVDGVQAEEIERRALRAVGVDTGDEG